MQGGRRRGQQKKRWENNISEWTGLKFCNAVREAENKIKWRERVAMSVVPQRSLTMGLRCWCRYRKSSTNCGTFHMFCKEEIAELLPKNIAGKEKVQLHR